jgi:CheY-like chemotaxis protein
MSEYRGTTQSAIQRCRAPAYGVHDGGKVLLCTFIAPQARDEAVAAMLTSHSGPYRSLGLKLNGSVFPIEIAAGTIRFQEGTARLFTVRDLSPIAIVVDEELPVLNVTGALLRLSGYQTVVYTSARRARDEYEVNGASVLISDVTMPEVDGPELVRGLRERDPLLPVVFISGGFTNPLPLDDQTVFVKKPFRTDDLLGALATLPERARSSIS